MAGRYYDSCGSAGEIQPGKISAELKAALNLPANDIPIWIYRMRALGYPPGWLKKAIVDTDDIFDTESGSKKRKNPPNDEVQYDHSKLIEYPGFNAPMPQGCLDYHYYINMPAMLEHQQLEYAKKHMNFFKPIQPKKMKGDPIELIDLIDAAPSTNSIADASSSEGIKLISKGSPMPKPVGRAPLERFSEGVVGDLLYFENIATSTGKFDTIRGLLNTMRKSKGGSDTSFETSEQEK